MEEQQHPIETKQVGGDISVGDAAVYSYEPSDDTPAPVIISGGTIVVPPDAHPSGFFDPSDPSRPPDIILRRVRVPRPTDPAGRTARQRAWRRVVDIMTDPEREMFQVLKPIAYHDAALDLVIVVPADLETFRTDLTSVPQLFTWLVPKTGVHLPAALLHDGLVHDPKEPPSYIANAEISRADSDRIFRDGMRGLGTSWLRRWLVWATVMVATLVSGTERARWLTTVVATFATIAVCGTLATIDLVDCREIFPWMGARPWWQEVVNGVAAAVVITGGLSVLWWPLDRASARHLLAGAAGAAVLVGALLVLDDTATVLAVAMVVAGSASILMRPGRVALIAGLALSLLYHVTVAVTVVYGVFTIAESVAERRWVRAGITATATGMLLGALVAVGWWAC